MALIRRNSTFAFFAFLSWSVTVLAAPSLGPACKSVPGTPLWPSTATWSALNNTIEGRLIAPSPPGSVCHPGQPDYNATACWIVQWSWSNEFFHDRDPVSSEWNNWNNDSCLPDPGVPCNIDGFPVYVINATTPAHVKAGVDFARVHNIRLIVKNSGHDYVGRSSGAQSLSIWVHHMKWYTTNEKSFSPKSCNITIEGPSITAGGGTQMLEAYAAAAATNHTVVGGGGRTVALGGFLTGAGHSILAPAHGLATDQILEMDIVTPKGEILTLNECMNTDLFWAMRGGGGSTFGIMTSVTMKMIPTPSIMDLNFRLSYPSNSTSAFKMIAYMLSHFPSLADAGVSGYPIVFNSVPSDDGSHPVSGLMGKVIMLNTSDPAMIMSQFQPLFDHINATWPGYEFLANTSVYKDHFSWYLENYDNSPVGYENIMGSRLLDQKALQQNESAVVKAMETFSQGGYATVYIVSGKGVHEAVPRGGSNAVLPAWRRTYVHATAQMAFAPLNATAEQSAIKATTEWAQGLRDLAPDTGAYMNEGSGRYEPNWQKSFWGDNYARLLKIKQTADPDDVLWCNPCVGNEGWQEVGKTLCRVPAFGGLAKGARGSR